MSLVQKQITNKTKCFDEAIFLKLCVRRMQRTKNSEIKLCPFNELKGLLSNGGTAMSHCAKNEGI